MIELLKDFLIYFIIFLLLTHYIIFFYTEHSILNTIYTKICNKEDRAKIKIFGYRKKLNCIKHKKNFFKEYNAKIENLFFFDKIISYTAYGIILCALLSIILNKL